MVMRLTENLKFNTTANNIFLSQSRYAELMEQIASQKRINRPSDDPVGTRTVLDYRGMKSSIEQYMRNIDGANGWLSVTETKLTGARDIVSRLREIAVSQGSANASAESRRIAASTVEDILDEMLSLANTEYGGRYLFTGSRSDTEPFSGAARTATSIAAPEAAPENTYTGAVARAGTYTGATNKTCVVKIEAGGDLAAATYRVSSDGGRTWGAVQGDLDTGTIAIGEGISLTFAAGTFAANDVFSVQAYTAGYYSGNGEELSIQIGEGATFSYNIPGESVFTDRGEGSVDVFGTIESLKTALQDNDAAAVTSTLDNLIAAYDAINLRISECGTKQNRLELATSSLTDLDLRVTELMSGTEDADTAQVIMQFKQKELALQAAYQIAASIGQSSILPFLR